MSYKLNSPHNNDLIFQALLLVYGSALEILHFLSFAITLMLSHFVCLRRNISKYIHFSWRAKVTKSNRLEEAVYRVHGSERLRGQLAFCVKKKSGQSSQGKKENREQRMSYTLFSAQGNTFNPPKTDTNPCHLGGHCLHPVSGIFYRWASFQNKIMSS